MAPQNQSVVLSVVGKIVFCIWQLVSPRTNWSFKCETSSMRGGFSIGICQQFPSNLPEIPQRRQENGMAWMTSIGSAGAYAPWEVLTEDVRRDPELLVGGASGTSNRSIEGGVSVVDYL